MSGVLHTLEEITHNGWFVAIDILFHVFILGHVIAHICRLGKRFHNWVHVPLARMFGGEH